MTDTDTMRRRIAIVAGAGGPKAMTAGHRVRVADVVVWHEKLGMSPDEIVDAIPTLTLVDVHAALACSWDNRDDLDRQLDEHLPHAIARSVQRLGIGVTTPRFIYAYFCYAPGRGVAPTMTREPLTITIDPDSELARALADADVAVILESDGVRYTVSPENVFARYDAPAVLRALRQSRGTLAGVNVAELLTDLDEQRSQDPSRRPV
jgi:uncharacterized protein (DUF433 family)